MEGISLLPCPLPPPLLSTLPPSLPHISTTIHFRKQNRPGNTKRGLISGSEPHSKMNSANGLETQDQGSPLSNKIEQQ